MRFVADKSPPPLTEGDTRERDDPEWLEAAAAYVEAKRAADAVAKALDAAKAKLIGLASHAQRERWRRVGDAVLEERGDRLQEDPRTQCSTSNDTVDRSERKCGW